MQRYVAVCGAVFMHKQARLSTPRCKPLRVVVSPETTGAPRMLQRYQVAAGVPVPLGSQPPSPYEALRASPSAFSSRRARGDAGVTHEGRGSWHCPCSMVETTAG